MVLTDRSIFLEGRRLFEFMSYAVTSLEKADDGKSGLVFKV